MEEQTLLRRNDDFKQVVIEELVSIGIYTKEHDRNPQKALVEIINWHVSVALDPNVSQQAHELVERGRREARWEPQA